MALFSKKKTTTKQSEVVIPETLIERCKKAIDIEIAPEFRAEANEIIDLGGEEIRNEFIGYFEKKQGNICCLVLDKAKQGLIKEGKLVSKDTDAFGKPFML